MEFEEREHFVEQIFIEEVCMRDFCLIFGISSFNKVQWLLRTDDFFRTFYWLI